MTRNLTLLGALWLFSIGEAALAGPQPVLLLIAARDFSYEEFQPVRDGLQRVGLTVQVCSEDTQPARALNDSLVRPDVLVRDANPTDYSALVVIGGIGSVTYWSDSAALGLVRSFVVARGEGRHGGLPLLGAIGIGPILLAKAGVLKGRNATVYADFRAIEFLQQGGARYVSKDVVIDDGIVTGSDAGVAEKMAQALAKLLGSQNRAGTGACPY
jgi:protease I